MSQLSALWRHPKEKQNILQNPAVQFATAMIPGVGPILSAAEGAGGSALAGGNLGQDFMGGLSGLGAGSLGKGAMSLFGGGNPLSSLGSIFGGGSGGSSPFTSSMNPFSLFGGGGSGGTSSGGSSNPFTSLLGGQSGFANTSSGGNSSGNKNWWESLLGGNSGIFPGGNAQGLLGLGLPFFGNMAAPKVQAPDYMNSPNVQALQNFKPGNSISPEYQTMIQNNTNKLRDQRVRELQGLYRSARPGTDYLTDTNYQRDLGNIETDVQNNMTDELAKAEGQFSGQDQERLTNLAQLDIFQIMTQTGMSAQEANDFKQMFSNVGNMFLTNATRDPNQMSNLMSLFGGA